MTDDVLKRATEALRDETSAPEPRSGLTRSRLLDSAEKRYASPRRQLMRWLITLASLFVVGTAMAHFSGSWPALREAIFAPAPAMPVAAKKPSEHPAALEQVAAKTAEPAVETTPSAAPTPIPWQPPPATTHRTTRSAPAPAAPPTMPPPSAAPPVRSAELELFRRANTLQVARDPAALAAWDAYLRVAERGVLIPEARYNRALCLVRLGRSAEARVALAPFARGDFGEYRRSEARALLDALSK
jgi:hypothetical protein